MQTSRRQFIQAGLTGAAAAAVTLNAAQPGFAARLAPAASGQNVLVVIHLSGGNDGLNTVIPTRSAAYRDARPHVSIREGYHPISRDLALNPGLGAFKDLFDQGRLAVVNGCGYPQHSRSHFRALEIWHSADPVCSAADGWLGRCVEQIRGGAEPSVVAVHAGSQVPQALLAGEAQAPCVHPLDQFRVPSDVDSPRDLRAQLQVVARLVDQHAAARVFYCQLGGFDTHANQLRQHQNQLAQLADAVVAFQEGLAAKGHADRVTVMCFSEFGRRLVQNNSNGTDHGTSGPVFVVGNKVKGGLYGAHPSLTDLDDQGDLKYTTDFRRVYATLLDRWLNVDSARILNNRFEPLAFL
jgi:uncharacterized protein (DUF1501 family)